MLSRADINNNQETNRTTVSEQVDERTRFEIYYPPFEGAVKADVGSMMCSYNRISTTSDRLGNWSCEHPQTLTTDLRERLNFSGWMMSDWGAVHSDSIMQGLDQEMPGSLFLSTVRLNRSVFGWSETLGPPINKSLHFPPTVTMERIDQAVTRILLPMFKLGLFERPFMALNSTANNVTSAEHNVAARKLARAAMVLLQNEDSLLPLDLHTVSGIAVIGKDAAQPVVGGGGSGGSFPAYKSAPLTSIRRRFAGIEPPPSLPAQCPGKVLQHTDLANGDDVTSFPATSKCGAGPDCGQPNISLAQCCAMCSARGDRRGSPGPCAAYSYVGTWNSAAGLGHGLIYACNLHGTAASPIAATNKSCFNLTDDEGKYKCSVATSGIIRSSPPPPTPDCAGGKCVYYADGSDVAAAAKIAAKNDVAIIFVSTDSGEGSDRSTLSLGDTANKLVAAVAAGAKKTVVMMVHPGAVLTPWRGDVDAIVASFMPGQEYGSAATDLLFGEDEDGISFSPSARLPLTFPTKDNEMGFTQEQFPGVRQANGTGDCQLKAHCDDPADHNCAAQSNEANCQFSNYTEGLHVGYRWYQSHAVEPAFAFGHGLTFSSFDYSGLTVTPTLAVFTLRNNGSRPAATVAQLYLTYPTHAGEPPHQLKGFQRTDVLAPGESVPVSFELTPRDFSIWSVGVHAWSVVSGEFAAAVGESSQDTRLSATVTVRK